MLEPKPLDLLDTDYATLIAIGLVPKSMPQLLDIAEFWSQYYFSQSLRERFPKLISS